MGLVKTYQRYSIVSQFGVVGSSRSNIVLLKKSGSRPKSLATADNISYLAASGANEDINIWDTRKGELVLSLQAFILMGILYFEPSDAAFFLH